MHHAHLPNAKALDGRCSPLHAPAVATTAARLLPPSGSNASRLQLQLRAARLPSQQLTDDLDIIDALFESALNPSSNGTTAGQPSGGALKSSSPASSSAVKGRSKSSTRSPASLPKRAAPLPWGSPAAATAAASAVKPSSAKQAAACKAAAAAASSKLLQQLRQQASNTASTAASSRKTGSSSSSSRRRQVSGFADYDDQELWEETGSKADDGWLDQEAAGASSALPANPWLLRRQQQQKQRQQKAMQAAAAAAADRREDDEEEEGEHEQLAVQQQLQRQLEWRALQQQQQQQQQSSAPSSSAAALDDSWDSSALPTGVASSSNAVPAAAQLVQQQLRQLPQQNVQEQRNLHEQAPLQTSSISSPDTGAAELQQQPQARMQALQQQQARTLPQAQLPPDPAALDGVVRSARRLRMQQRAAPATPNTLWQQQQQQQQDQVASSSLPDQPAAAAAAAAAISPSIGLGPLIVLGGQAAGSQVVWAQPPSMAAPAATPQQQQQQQRPALDLEAATLQEIAREATAKTVLAKQDSSSSSTAIGTSTQAGLDYAICRPAAAAAGGAAGTTPAAAVKARYRRGRSVQGVTTKPAELPPPLPAAARAEAAAALDAVDAAAAAAAAAASQQMSLARPAGPTGGSAQQAAQNELSSFVSQSISSSSSGVEGLQELLQGLDSSSWQHLASQVLPELYDPSWHSSMYAFMQDVWQAALQQGTARAAAAAASGSSSSSTGTAVSWCLEALYCSRRYIWGSTVLALADSLAEDDAGLVVQAVQLLPDQLLEQLVLPAAELLDDEVHAALQQEVKRKKVRAGGNTAAAAAAQALIAPAPWTLQQQQHQQRETGVTELQQSSSSSGHNADVRGSSAVPDLAVSAGAAAGDIAADTPRAVPGARQVVGLLQELQQLQGLYPGVDLAALAHVAQAHGLWRN
jgi:hypothetical protein